MAKDDESADKSDVSLSEDATKRAKLVKTGIGIGIGSAAVVAALLYANHNKKKKPTPID
jgi:hypothetical protein